MKKVIVAVAIVGMLCVSIGADAGPKKPAHLKNIVGGSFEKANGFHTLQVLSKISLDMQRLVSEGSKNANAGVVAHLEKMESVLSATGGMNAKFKREFRLVKKDIKVIQKQVDENLRVAEIAYKNISGMHRYFNKQHADILKSIIAN